MKIFLGSDHNGYYLKEKVFAYLAKRGYDAEDVGGKDLDPDDDFPQFAQMAAIVCADHLNMHRLGEMKASTILKLLQRMDAFRKPERVSLFAQSCEADARGRLGLEDCDYPQGHWLREVFAAAAAIRAADVDPQLRGPAIGTAIEQARIQAIRDRMASMRESSEPSAVR